MGMPARLPLPLRHPQRQARRTARCLKPPSRHGSGTWAMHRGRWRSFLRAGGALSQARPPPWAHQEAMPTPHHSERQALVSGVVRHSPSLCSQQPTVHLLACCPS